MKNFILKNFNLRDIIDSHSIDLIKIEEFFLNIPSFFVANYKFSRRDSLIFASYCVTEETIFKDFAIDYLDYKKGSWINFKLKINNSYDFANQILKVKDYALNDNETETLLKIVEKDIIYEIYETKKMKYKLKLIQNPKNINSYEFTTNLLNDSLVKSIMESFKHATLSRSGKTSRIKCTICKKNDVKIKNSKINIIDRCVICKNLEYSLQSICYSCLYHFENNAVIWPLTKNFCCIFRYNEYISDIRKIFDIKNYNNSPQCDILGTDNLINVNYNYFMINYEILNNLNDLESTIQQITLKKEIRIPNLLIHSQIFKIIFSHEIMHKLLSFLLYSYEYIEECNICCVYSSCLAKCCQKNILCKHKICSKCRLSLKARELNFCPFCRIKMSD